jgi:hypothetical protein
MPAVLAFLASLLGLVVLWFVFMIRLLVKVVVVFLKVLWFVLSLVLRIF